MPAGDTRRTLTFAEVERRLVRASAAIPLELDETAELLRLALPEVYQHRPPDTPTAAVPGSAEKLRALERRAARGESLFGPADDNHHPDRALLVGRHDSNGATLRLGVVGEHCTAGDYAVRGDAAHRNSRPSTRNPPPGDPDTRADRPLTRTQLARRLGLSTWAVRGLVRAGRIPWTWGPGGRRLFDEAAVRAALEAAGHRLPS